MSSLGTHTVSAAPQCSASLLKATKGMASKVISWNSSHSPPQCQWTTGRWKHNSLHRREESSTCINHLIHQKKKQLTKPWDHQILNSLVASYLFQFLDVFHDWFQYLVYSVRVQQIYLHKCKKLNRIQKRSVLWMQVSKHEVEVSCNKKDTGHSLCTYALQVHTIP